MHSKSTTTKLITTKKLTITAFGLVAFVIMLAVIEWGSNLQWHFSGISPYQMFPLLGLLAFSIMWAHYVIGFINHTFFEDLNIGIYYKTTGYAVLFAILFHPGILIFQRFRDGFGLPPGSTYSYVQQNAKWAVMLGTVSLLAFLAFELHRWYSKRSWWKYVVSLNDAAMLAIFFHGLKLGSNLQGGWYQTVWYFYGIILIAILLDKYIRIIYRLKPQT